MNLPSREPRAGRHSELALHVVVGVEQNAARLLLVPTRAAGLLKVVLKRAWDIRVNDQANVGLVDAHAEGIRGDDGPQIAADEARLDVFLGLRGQAGVEVVGRYALGLEEGGQLFGVASRRRIDDGPAGCIRRQVGVQDQVDSGDFSPRVVGTTTNSRLVRCAPPSKTLRSIPSSFWKYLTMSAFTSGFASR